MMEVGLGLGASRFRLASQLGFGRARDVDLVALVLGDLSMSRFLGPRRLGHLLGVRGANGLRDARDGADGYRREHEHRRRQRDAIAARKLAKTVCRRRPARLDRLVAQVPLDVACQVAGRRVAPRAVLLQRFHHDPIEIAAHRAPELRRI
ncbi:MAG: hypothetical protein WD845_14130 [Pirellulales bacterium]